MCDSSLIINLETKFKIIENLHDVKQKYMFFKDSNTFLQFRGITLLNLMIFIFDFTRVGSDN